MQPIRHRKRDPQNRKGQSRLDQNSRHTRIRLESLGGQDPTELFPYPEELEDDEEGDDDVEGDGERCPGDAKVDCATLEEEFAWFRTLVKGDDCHGCCGVRQIKAKVEVGAYTCSRGRG